jgi:formate dehydrogenase subunit gamma
LSARASSVNAATGLNDNLPAEILRFRASERQLHWSIAIPFLICYTTALILVSVYNPDPNRPYRLLVSWIHRLSGVCLFVFPLSAFARHRHDLDLHYRNARTAWRWRLDDVKWLFLMGPATINKRISLPDQEKFNAAEKINFIVLSLTFPMYIMTGLSIWLPGVAYLSWMIHLSMAATATPLILGHIFMATVNPDTRVGLSGMISGFVSRHWAEHHYRCWYEENFGHLKSVGEPAIVEPAIVGAAPDRCSEVPLEPISEDEPPASSWPSFIRSGSRSRTVTEST